MASHGLLDTAVQDGTVMVVQRQTRLLRMVAAALVGHTAQWAQLSHYPVTAVNTVQATNYRALQETVLLDTTATSDLRFQTRSL